MTKTAKIIFSIRWFMALVLLGLGAGYTVASEVDQYTLDAEAAQKYSDTYLVRNIPGLRAFLAEDAIFDDPANHFEGVDGIIDGLGPIFADVTRLEFEPSAEYRSGNMFVYSGRIDFNYMMALSVDHKQEFNFQLDFMVVLKIENGQIVHHTDFYDTEGFSRQFQAQIQNKQED